MASAAMMYSSFLTFKIWLRTIRAILSQYAIPNATKIDVRPGPSTTINKITYSKSGMPYKTSTMPIMIRSTLPPI